MLVRTENGTQDVPLINAMTGEYNVNAGNYIVPAGEEHLYHVLQEQKKFNAETGKRMSKPFVQKYGKKEYETIVQRQLRLQNTTVVMLHEPVIVENKATAQPQAQTGEVLTLKNELAALKAEMAAMKAKANHKKVKKAEEK